jgi:predicted nucleic acid-binding Zn ribbon protein
MPTYTYQVITDDGSEGEIFEVHQSMRDDALTHHPTTGAPVHRIIVSPPALGGAWKEGGNVLSQQNLENHGFSRFERTGDDSWAQTAGKGKPGA